MLYAEDNPGDVRLVELLIKGEGEQLIELKSVDRLQGALSILQKGRVDILLLDLTLPDSNGIETVSKAVRAAPEVPIVVLTGFKDLDLGIRALRAGAMDFLSKYGLSGELLVRTLKLAAERAQLERKLRESERRYALAAEGSNDGLWDWDLRTNLRSPWLERIVGATLAESALEPSSLRLEITEGTAMGGLEDSPLLRRLCAQGVRLAIDDFGTGYSSLAALHLIPVECLKIDKTFVQRLGPKGENGEVVQAIIAMANSLGLETIAEGVETRSQLAVLKQLGCGYGQGYHFSRPVPVEDAHRMLLLKRNRLGGKSS